MSLRVPPSVDVLQEGLLGDTFFADCWPAGFPAACDPPGPRDLAVLEDLMAGDVVVAGLDVVARGALRALALGVERRVPLLSSSGRPLPGPHRLFLALEMAKVCRAAPRDDLARLASVVVYPGVTRLRRGHGELGALLMRGAFLLLPDLVAIQTGATLLLEVAAHGGDGLRGLRRALHRVVDESEVWRRKIAPGHALPDDDEALAAFAARARRAFGGCRRALGRDRALRRVLAGADVDVGALADHRVSRCEQLAAATGALAVASQASIHLPWSTQLACHTTTGHDPLIHELAHLVDFCGGGIDGTPTVALAPRWRAAWEDLEGSAAALDAGARQSPAELFAVAAEAFFTDAGPLRRASPILAALLEETWGQAPPPRPRRSGWWLARHLLFPPLGSHFD